MKNLIILILVFSFSFCYGQDRSVWRFSKSEWIGYAAMVGSGVAKGYNQAIIWHHWGRGSQFWDKDISWKNKYRDWDAGDKREAFPLSKNVFVFTTDGMHLTGTINTTFLIVGTTAISLDMKSELKQIPKKQRWIYVLLHKIIIPVGIRALAFELTYTNL